MAKVAEKRSAAVLEKVEYFLFLVANNIRFVRPMLKKIYRDELTDSQLNTLYDLSYQLAKMTEKIDTHLNRLSRR